MFTPDTLNVFAELLAQVQIGVSHPDFLAQAQRLGTAKEELAAAFAEAQRATAPDPEQP